MYHGMARNFVFMLISQINIHPLDKNRRVYMFLDICDMIKLVRSTLGDSKILVDGDGQKICWDYITELQKLQ